MSDEKPRAKKLVVKKTVVKKAVAKPGEDSRATLEPQSGTRTPQPPTALKPTSRSPRARAERPPDSRTKESPSSGKKAKVPKPPKTRPSSVGSWTAGTGRRAGRRMREGTTSVRNFFSSAAHRVVLPHLAPLPAATVTGALAGVLTTLLGAGSLALYSWFRGVASGGGLLGSLTIFVIAIVTFFFGARLLDSLGVRQPRLTCALGIMLTLILYLLFLIDISVSLWIWLLVPIAGAASFGASHLLLAFADKQAPKESEPSERA